MVLWKMLFVWDVMSWDAEKKKQKVLWHQQLKDGLLLSTGGMLLPIMSLSLPTMQCSLSFLSSHSTG